MNDFQALNEALEEMRFTEDVGARDRLVRDALLNNVDAETMALARELSKAVKKEQKRRGVVNPICGDQTALEILFMAWLSEQEKGESNG